MCRLHKGEMVVIIKNYHIYMSNFSRISTLVQRPTTTARERRWMGVMCCTENAQDKTSTCHNGTKLRPKMNNEDDYNKGVIQKCSHTPLEEVVMSMMFTKAVLFFYDTNIYHKFNNT